MPYQYAVNDRVQCLATRFDDQPDAQGRLFSELHEKKEKTKFCYGTVKRVLADKLHYKVLWDGDKRQYKSAAAHLSLFTEDDSSSSSDSGPDDGDDLSSAAGSDDGDDDMLLAPKCTDEQSESDGEPLSDEDRDADADMDSDADVDSRMVDKGNESDEDRGSSNAIGDEVEVAGLTWKRVESMGGDKRGGRPKSKMEMRKLKVNSHTRASDFWKELLPVPVERVLEVVKENAKLHRDNAKHDEEGLMGWCCCLHGGCQFKPGTEAWTSEKRHDAWP